MKAILIVLVIAVIGVIGFLFVKKQPSTTNTGSITTNNTDNNQSATPATDNAKAVLSVTPVPVTTSVGQTFSVDVVLDTAGNAVDGVDVASLTYDPAILSVVDQDTSKSGTQIKDGTNFDLAYTKIESGKITFSVVTKGGVKYTGTTPIGTIKFKALKKGQSALNIDYTAGSTKDSNVASVGKDILSSVNNSSVTVQ